MQTKMVSKDAKQSQPQLDSGKVNKKIFWEEASAMFSNPNVTFPFMFGDDMHVRNTQCNPNIAGKSLNAAGMQEC